MSVGQIQHIKPKCPDCGALLDGFASPAFASPEAGDLSLCVYCETWLQFNNDLSLMGISTDEISALPLDTQLAFNSALRAMRQMKKAAGP